MEVQSPPKARKAPPPFKKVTDDERAQMRTLYLEGHSSYEVGRRLGRSFKAVINNLRLMGVPIRDSSMCAKKYTLREDYFQYIDTPEKAYVLGFIYADGNIRGNRLKIALWDTDRPVLKSMLAEMGSNAPLGTERPKEIQRSDMAVLCVFGRVFCGHLRAKGVIEAKTHRITLPDFLSDDLLRYFVLGYFDGDGCISSYVDKENCFRFVAGFAGHEGFIRALQAYFERVIGARGSFNVFPGKGRSLNFNCVKGLKVMNHLYRDLHKFYLSRKYQRYIDIVNRMQSRREHKAPETLSHIDSGLQIILQNAA